MTPWVTERTWRLGLMRGLAFLLLAVNVTGCRTQALVDAPAELPSQYDLYRAFRQHAEVLVVYGAQDPAAGARYRALLEKLDTRTREHKAPSRKLQLRIRSDREVSQEELRQYPTFLIGTPASNQWLMAWEAQLPLAFEEQAFTFFGTSYADPSQAFILPLYPHPLQDTLPLPLGLITGNDDAAILALLESRYEQGWFWLRWGSWGYEIH
ncbi:MAG: hypothetical protein AAGB22_00095, partial [Bacteroidota bacterium]